ncbi:hypothetical protein DFH11DRAFT_1773545 [Phellopilus nigrolimitatus]|nr:hypothetical protein DFH11DRAFT_1773545 [Phellopilus nigrolimitatus]
MASTDIDHWQPVSNPAAVASTASTASTPGLGLPGSYPPDANERSDAAANRRDALDHLSDAASPNTVSSVIQDSREAAAQYLPTREGVQHAFAGGVDSMRDYLPGRVVGAFGSHLPESTKDTPTVDAQPDPASTAKPMPISSETNTAVDNASMTALAPSTRSLGSPSDVFADNFTWSNTGADANENGNGEISTGGVENAASVENADADPASAAKLDTPNASNAPSTPAAHIPLHNSDPPTPSVSKYSIARLDEPIPTGTMHIPPPDPEHGTPPASRTSSPSAKANSPARVPLPGSERDLSSSNMASLPTPPPSHPATPSATASASAVDASPPRPPPKDSVTEEPAEQPDRARLAASPAQAHVKDGAGVSVAAMGGAKVPSTSSLGSTASAGAPVPDGKAASDEDKGDGKKKGKARRLVGRVKDKMHHWGH